MASERSAPPPAGRSAAATKTVPPAADVSPFAMGLLLRQAHEQVAEAMDEVLRPFGIERRHLMVLMRLDADGPLSQRDLVVLTRHDKASMVRIVDDLERLGLASREAVVGDRRLRAVTLTDEGRRVFADAHRAATPAADSALQPLTAGEIAQLRGLLRRLTSR
ncbi:DNA-binding MarR family transcriptional regulator [Motilibacter peucedani]|uniref:DNA-binding MarR family transcriptional regulator n=1 Tax=Motilibacter peucedani TaxID=598650 RepID=A0A420XSX0_9ACTN|nr:DNA-binding MarR family transcriptional regulator [Motilibacter peucedani]